MMTGETRSPLRGRYLVQRRTWNAFLHVADSLLDLMAQPPRELPVTEPRRILLATGGHLGDGVIATSAIALVRQAFPHAEIGLALGSWARAAVEGHPQLRWIHTVDHWKMNRSGASLARRLVQDRSSRERALREIRAVAYDAAVDLYMYYPNMAGLLWRAGIPVRIGYTSGGYGALYTHRVEWRDDDHHTAEQHRRLLTELAPSLASTSIAGYSLPPVPGAARARAEAIMRESGIEPGGYVVIHMGAGSPIREWPLESWRRLSHQLVADGHRVVLTGSGAVQERAIAEVANGQPGCVDLGGRLGWHEFVHVLGCARLVICVETVASHIAAAVGTPCLALWTGITRLSHWRPMGDHATVLTGAVPCAPCFRRRGCETMACVRGLTVDHVADSARALLRQREQWPAADRSAASGLARGGLTAQHAEHEPVSDPVAAPAP
jgi:ADP-heptose:LPS heptosyltransferase